MVFQQTRKCFNVLKNLPKLRVETLLVESCMFLDSVPALTMVPGVALAQGLRGRRASLAMTPKSRRLPGYWPADGAWTCLILNLHSLKKAPNSFIQHYVLKVTEIDWLIRKTWLFVRRALATEFVLLWVRYNLNSTFVIFVSSLNRGNISKN